jgi:hypothetical protein
MWLQRHRLVPTTIRGLHGDMLWLVMVIINHPKLAENFYLMGDSRLSIYWFGTMYGINI